MKKVKITQIKSSIKRNKKQVRTLDGLGLRKIGSNRVHNLTPQIEGMINKISFLVKVEEVTE